MRARQSWLLIAAAAAIVAAPLIMPTPGTAFKGTDDLAVAAIGQARPGYHPWAQPLWTPPSAEIESLLFAVQAAVGAGVLGYVIGRRHGRRPEERDHVADR